MQSTNKNMNKYPTKEEIVAVRKAAGMTQVDVAKAMKMHETTVQRWEAGTCPMHPSLFELLKIKAKKQSKST